jgi:hypothetical protein
MPFEGYSGVTLLRIWPAGSESIAWRDAPLLSDAAVIALHEALAMDLKPID